MVKRILVYLVVVLYGLNVYAQKADVSAKDCLLYTSDAADE